MVTIIIRPDIYLASLLFLSISLKGESPSGHAPKRQPSREVQFRPAGLAAEPILNRSRVLAEYYHLDVAPNPWILEPTPELKPPSGLPSISAISLGLREIRASAYQATVQTALDLGSGMPGIGADTVKYAKEALANSSPVEQLGLQTLRDHGPPPKDPLERAAYLSKVRETFMKETFLPGQNSGLFKASIAAAIAANPGLTGRTNLMNTSAYKEAQKTLAVTEEKLTQAQRDYLDVVALAMVETAAAVESKTYTAPEKSALEKATEATEMALTSAKMEAGIVDLEPFNKILQDVTSPPQPSTSGTKAGTEN